MFYIKSCHGVAETGENIHEQIKLVVNTGFVVTEPIKQRFLTTFNILMDGRNELLANYRLAQSALCDCSKIDAEMDGLRREIEVVAELEDMKRQRQAKNLKPEAFIRELETHPLAIDEFDERLWAVAVDTIKKDVRLVYSFRTERRSDRQ
jgi:site-specific DNA recombinase